MKTFSIFFISLLALSFGSKAQMSQVEGQSPSRAVSIKKASTTVNPTPQPIVVQRGKREALLIGNGNYQFGNKLGQNPINDANDLAKALTSLGFTVKVISDASLATLKQAVRDFEVRIKGAEMAAFFFGGHGIETGGKKYIIPIDAQLKSPTDAEEDAYNIEVLFKRLRTGGAKHNLIVLDACRNDPFKEANPNDPEEARAWGDDTNRGFTPIELNKMPEGNLYLAMATGWGRKAQNGTGKNGTYSSGLLKQIKAGERLERVFDRTAIDVKKSTKNAQNPQFVKEVSIEEEFIF